MRLLLPTLCLLVAACLLADAAWAEEVFVLENGVVIRGRVVRENDEKIVIRLAGFTEENKITVRTREIVRRFASTLPRGAKKDRETLAEPPLFLPTPVPQAPPTPLGQATPSAHASTSPSGFDDPPLEAEGFFERLKRVTGLALPKSFEGLLLVTFLFLVMLTVFVAAGTHTLNMRAPSLHASTSLGLLLGIFFAADILLHHEILRADRAIWILPLQCLLWLGVARAALDAPMGKLVPLFAFVLFASTCFVFFTGSVLVSV